MSSFSRFAVLCASLTLAFFAGRASSPKAMSNAATLESPKQAASAPVDEKTEDAFSAPGSAHRALQPLIGTFQGTVKMWSSPEAKPMMITGTLIREWVLGGRYMQETYSSPMENGEFHGIGFLGYNAFDGRYEFVWMDSESTAIVLETGSLNTKSNVLTVSTSVRDTQSGRLVLGRGTVDFSDADHQKSVSYHVGANGEEYKAFEAVFDRVKE